MAPDAASWSRWIPSVPTDGIDSFVLVNAHVPLCTVSGVDGEGLQADHDGLVRVDIVIRDGKVLDISPAGTRDPPSDVRVVDADGGMCWPTFSDIHTHIDKGHTCERSRNHSGSLAGADDSCAKDEAFWSQEDVRRRMEFSLKSAYAHGTSAVRTHIMSGPKQAAIAWPVFHELREKWRGKIELQGVSLSILRFFRDEDAAAELADTVKERVKNLGYDRYKLVVQVTVGEKTGQALRLASRCLWDTATDNFASDFYENSSVFCVGMVFGLYYE